jgi:prepilin-type N-terminal cleavage/methylation domain-containing protein
VFPKGKSLEVVNYNEKESVEMKKLRMQSESGFTLIELLVVVAIIGILAAIAIPQFAAYRKRGHEAQVKSDLRNAAVSQEAYFAANSTYLAATMASGTPPGFNATTGVTVIAAVVANSNAFTLTAQHANCSNNTWTFSSSTGQITGAACP